MRNYLLSFYDRCLEGKRLRLHYRTVKTTSVHQILNAYATIFILHMCIIYLLTFISIIFLFRSTYTLSVWQNGTAYNFFGSNSCVLHFRYKGFRIKIVLYNALLWENFRKTLAYSIFLSDVSKWGKIRIIFFATGHTHCWSVLDFWKINF